MAGQPGDNTDDVRIVKRNSASTYFTLFAGAGAVWVANALDGQVVRIDPATGRIVARIDVGTGLRELAAGPGEVWVTRDENNGGQPITPAPRRFRALINSAYIPHGSATAARSR